MRVQRGKDVRDQVPGQVWDQVQGQVMEIRRRSE